MSPGDLSTDLRAIVECLFAAHYSEREIIAYLSGPFGLTEEQATIAVRQTAA